VAVIKPSRPDEPVARGPPPITDLGRSHVALRQKIAAQAVSDLARVDPVVLLFG
jgi:hypothetical protein